MKHEPLADRLTPSEVMEQVAQAMPPTVRGNVIIVGSLAAGYNFFSGDGAASMRTTDVDMLFSQHAVAVDAAVEVTEALLVASWTQKADSVWAEVRKST